ncbi:transposase [Streptomyces sp. NPDC059455]|uniref:transposase n=1 Tax=Streptomyces sp. NPDC059455 TaxID=3346837 RepID=UPI00369895D8
MDVVVTAREPDWVGLFAGLNERQFRKLVVLVRRRGGGKPTGGRPWALPLEDRILLVAAYWRTNLTMRQLGPLFGISKSAADRVIDHIAPLLALAPVRHRHPADTLLIVDGTLVPTRDRGVAASSKNYRYSTNHQVVIDANTRLVVAAGRPLPGNRHDARAYRESGVDRAVKNAPVLGDGGYRGTPALIPHWPRKDRPLTPEQQADNAVHRRARARVEHAFSRMKTYKILRDCRLRGDGVHQAILGVARLHNLALAG